MVDQEQADGQSGPTPVAQATPPAAVAYPLPASTHKNALLKKYPLCPCPECTEFQIHYAGILPLEVLSKTPCPHDYGNTMSLNDLVWYQSPPLMPPDMSTPC